MRNYTVHDATADTLQVLNPEGQAVKNFPVAERDAAERYAGKRSGQRFNGIDEQRRAIVSRAYIARREGDTAALLAAQGDLLLLEPQY